MPGKIKVGVLTHGGGAHVGAYLQALAASEACGEVVLADPDDRFPDEARGVLGDKLTGTYQDYGELLDRERPAMVVVTMEARLAPPVIDRALQADCHVFAEKPSCIRTEDFAELVAKADGKQRHLMLALSNRTNPEIVAAREMISSNRIGRIYGIEIHMIADQTRLTRAEYRDRWVSQKARSGGGHLVWLGIHWLDLAMYVTGSDIAEVAGFTANVGGQPIDVEDSTTAALRFEDGTLGTVTSGYYLEKGYHSHIKIWGSQGWMHIDSMADAPLTWSTTQGAQAGVVQTWSGPTEPRGYTPFVCAAVVACAQNTDPPISSAHSLRAVSTVHSIYAAAETGRSVQVVSPS